MNKEKKLNIGKIREREITKEMEESYIDYAMSVIISRALPDVRDGLKPVQRRILYAMYEMGLKHDGKFRKSAAITGETMAKFHPHGDAPIYEALVRMAQDFSLRYPLITGQGNFGSIDGDPPGQQRYTEAKLSRIGEEMLKDIEKDTVDFVENYDGTKKEPTVLPSPLPQLLLNGSIGIAVGMATSIPPHNLSEVCDALIYLLFNPGASTRDLFKFIKGPDFPTGGQIFDLKSMIKSYSLGRGQILMRGKAEIIEEKRKIVITEIPYQVLKANLIKQIADLISEKKILGIKAIRDESDKSGMRIAIELKGDANPKKVLNALYKYSDLQKKFYLNMLALSNGIQPRVMNLVEILSEFLKFRKEIVYRRTKHDLKEAKERAHILEGIEKCLEKIDEVTFLIKKSRDKKEAKFKLMKNFGLDEIQANAILEIKLVNLAKLERKKIEDELKEKKKEIKEFSEILKSPRKIKEVIKKELEKIKEEYGDERRTKVFEQKFEEISEEELIPEEKTLIFLTSSGYTKRLRPKIFKVQKRGGRGIIGIETEKEDFIEQFLLANTREKVLFFSDLGKVYLLPVYEIPEADRLAKGKSLINFLDISPKEKISAISNLENRDFFSENHLMMATKDGMIKKTPLKDFRKIRKKGLLAIKLKKGDVLKSAKKVGLNDEIILLTKKGMAIRFKEKEIRPMGRNSAGVRAIKLRDDEVVGMEVIKKERMKKYLLTLTSNGFGKITPLEEYKLQKRGGIGVKAAKINLKTGQISSFKILTEKEGLIIISKRGQVLRMNFSSIPKLKRVSQGLRLMKLEEGDKIAKAISV